MKDKADGMKWYKFLLFIPLFVIMIPCFIVIHIKNCVAKIKSKKISSQIAIASCNSFQKGNKSK